MTVAATAQTTQTTQQTLATAARGATTSGADFNMFLRLLTTQMQNQDPLDPMKTSEYTQQLAQYSQIEQTVQQSGTLKEILARLSTQDLAQASGLIGRHGVFDTAIAGLSEAPATWSYAAARAVNSIVANVSDASGKVVHTTIIPNADASGRFTWDGSLAGGGSAPDGSYKLSFTAIDGRGDAVPVMVNSIGIVSDVAQADGIMTLGVNGVELPMSSLLRVIAIGS